MLLNKNDFFIKKITLCTVMGFRSFWSWLLGKEENIENFQATSSESVAVEQEPVKEVKERKKYQSVPRSKETKDFVQSLVRKSQTPDTIPRPHRDTTDKKAVEKFVGKLQGRE